MCRLILVAAVAALPFVSAADDARPRRSAASVGVPQVSQEKIARMRRALIAQIAVRDTAEGAMRAPTPQEASIFTLAPAGPADIVALPGGGMALRPDGSQTSLAIAHRRADGSISVTHDPGSAVRRAVAGGGAGNDR